VQAAADLPGAEAGLLGLQSDAYAVHGKLQQARATTEQAAAAARRDGSPEAAAVWLANAAYREALFGNVAEARRLMGEALAVSTGRDMQIAAAMTYAEIGDLPQAQKFVDQLNAAAPLDTIVQNYWLPSIRATMAIKKGEFARAVSLLEVTTPYELGLDNIGSMVPIYLRGTAYLKSGKATEAANEFQKIRTHRGVAGSSYIESLALLQLARAQALAGDTAAARRSYQDLLALWQQADADLGLRQQAQSDYDHLKN